MSEAQHMNILNVRYDNYPFEESIQRCVDLLRQPKKSNIFYLNVDCVYRAEQDVEYRQIVNAADMVMPDGVGIQAATRLFGDRMKVGTNVTDFFSALIRKLAETHCKIFLLGGREGVAKLAAEKLKAAIPSIQIVGTHSGFFDSDEIVLQRINNTGADVLIVAMGVPIQEKWIRKNRERLNSKVCIGVGALLDFWSGQVTRAPEFVKRVKLEWFWRMLMEPKRLWKRYLVDDMKVICLILKKKFSGR
jgi:N-acetylglucosaminyldiphosphoundecaprenol N-acetyl-beta-D-mannosaminyltransferase